MPRGDAKKVWDFMQQRLAEAATLLAALDTLSHPQIWTGLSQCSLCCMRPCYSLVGPLAAAAALNTAGI